MPSTFLAVSFVACLLASSVSGFAPASLAMSANIPAAGKKFDILLYGATGFTGKLVAAYLDKAMELSGPGKSWAIAGRSEDKLRTIGDALTTCPPDIVPFDLADKDAVEKMVASSRVVINCAGPYSTQNGEALLGACAKQGKHYSDLCGETFWQHEMVEAYHDIAAKSGAKIVLGGGVDSIPSDLGTFLALKQLKGRKEGEEVRVTGVYTEYTGSISGGTLASGRAIRAAQKAGRISKERVRDPYILAPGTSGLDTSIGTLTGMPRKWKRQWDPRYGMLMDFFMAPINAPVVRRSLALRNQAGSVWYRECTSIGMWTRLLWTWLTRGFGYFVGEPILEAQARPGPPQVASGSRRFHHPRDRRYRLRNRQGQSLWPW